MEAQALRGGAGVSRCRVCGRRVAAADPGCPEHGPAPRSGSGGEDARAERAPELPSFPGYRTLRLAGEGGFGAVYAAEPAAGGAEVAIKLARADRPEAGPTLVWEARILEEVGPPHAPVVYAQGELPDGSPYVVMEHLAVPTLSDRMLAAPGPLPVAEACALVCAALQALEVVHARGYVHRDLKPENIFIAGPTGVMASPALLRATIVDYGLAVPERGSARSSEGSALGTAEYMSPEQCEGRSDIDARADLYAVGVILYELLAGRPPFWGPAAAVREDHRSRRPPRLRPGVKVPAALEELVLRCLAKDRADRFASAAALREAVLGAARNPAESVPPSLSRPESIPASGPRNERRTVGLVIFDTDLDAVTLKRRLAALGGELAHTAGRRCVAVFDHEPGVSPVRRALRAARDLVRRGACSRALVDLAPVLVQRRAGGARRYLSPLFSREDLAPPDAHAEAPAIQVTPAAVAALPEGARGALDSVISSMPPGPIDVSLDEEGPGDTTFEPLIGRADILGALVDGARAVAASGLPTITSVIADTGLGKSHLASVLDQRLREIAPGAHVIDLRAREPLVGGADPTVREILQQALDLPAVPPPGGGRALLESRLGPAGAELVPAVALALGWAEVEIDGTGKPGDTWAAYPELRAIEAAPGALRAALTVAAGEALRQSAARGPVFVILDDAHVADDAALSALEYAALAEGHARVWVCALARPAFEQLRSGFGERAGRREVYRLGPLDREDAAALCRRLLAPVDDVPEPALDRLIARSQAIPLLLVELVLGLKREGIVRRHPKGGAWYVATDELDRLPEAPLIEWLARAELDALPPALQEHARLVAMLGAEVTVDEIAGVLQRLDRTGEGEAFPLDPGIATRRLLAAGVLVQDRRAGRVRFRHPLVREAMARSTAAPLRRRIHLAAFEHHRATPAGGEARLRALVHHAAEANLHDVAEGAYLTLAEHARARHAYVDAEALYSRALEQAEAARAAGEVEGAEARRRQAAARRGRGLMRYRLGRYHDALEDLAAARAAAEAEEDAPAQVEILLDEATAFDWMEEFRSSEARVDAARALAAAIVPLPPLLTARLLLGVGRSLHRFSREEEAAAALERAAAAAAELGDEGYETLVISLLVLGFIYPGLGRLDEAGAALDRAVDLCEAHRDALHLGPATNNRALLRACQGDKARMIADLGRVLAIARELGQGSLELVGEYNLGEYLYLMDDLDAAAPHIARALEIERRRSGDAGRPVAAVLDARFRLFSGDEPGARAVHDRIRAHQEAARASGRADALLLPSEEVLWVMVDLATRDPAGPDAGLDEAAWDALEARSARDSVGQEHIEVLEARAVSSLRRGRADEARRAIARALGAADRIPNVMGARLRRRADEIARA